MNLLREGTDGKSKKEGGVGRKEEFQRVSGEYRRVVFYLTDSLTAARGKWCEIAVQMGENKRREKVKGSSQLHVERWNRCVFRRLYCVLLCL